MLRYIVVIPVFCEPGITTTLESLWNCKRPSSDVEVIIVVNSPDNATQDIIAYNRSTVDDLRTWIWDHADKSMKFSVLDVRLPAKDAGVGLARRIGMDEAVSRFKNAGVNGYILSFDADSTCDPDYFTAIDDMVREKPATKGFTVYFEHPVSGTEYKEAIYSGIVQYELHLRYVNISLHLIGFPYAHHTIGSCFGVRADIYTAQGGMNRKKGGEDFYFLHKIIPLGNFEVVNTTCVHPSPRDSHRVPFGTGPVIRRFVETGEELTTYAPEIFNQLKQFLDIVPGFYKAGSETVKTQIDLLPDCIKDFLCKNNIQTAIKEINSNSGSEATFVNRFFRWFNAFRIVKFMNFASSGYYNKQPVAECTAFLLKQAGYKISENATALELLMKMREIERYSQ